MDSGKLEKEKVSDQTTIGKAPAFASNRCSNCDETFRNSGEQVTELKVGYRYVDADGEEEEKDVDSCKSIYIVKAVYSVFSTQSQPIEDVDFSKIGFCVECATVASQLYRHYVDLLNLSTSTSPLSQSIQQFQEWHGKNVAAGNIVPETQSSPKTVEKKEPVSEELGDDDTTKDSTKETETSTLVVKPEEKIPVESPSEDKDTTSVIPPISPDSEESLSQEDEAPSLREEEEHDTDIQAKIEKIFSPGPPPPRKSLREKKKNLKFETGDDMIALTRIGTGKHGRPGTKRLNGSSDDDSARGEVSKRGRGRRPSTRNSQKSTSSTSKNSKPTRSPQK